MNWNNMSVDSRLDKWKQLRKNLVGKMEHEKIDMVVEFLATFPIGSRSIDYYTPETWPTPWDIFYYGQFCVNGLSILAYHTLKMANVDVRLILVDFAGDIFLLPVIYNSIVLNFSAGETDTLGKLEQNDRFKIVHEVDELRIKQVV